MESLQLGLGAFFEHIFRETACGNQVLHNVDRDIPQLLMLFLQQNNNTGSLSIEGARDVEQGILNNALDGIVGNGALGFEAVESTTSLNHLQKGGGGRILEFNSSGSHCGGVVIQTGNTFEERVRSSRRWEVMGLYRL